MPTGYSKSVYVKTTLPNGEAQYTCTDDYIVESDMKLGYYIKSLELLSFNAQIQSMGL